MEKAIALAAAMATWFEERQILGRFLLITKKLTSLAEKNWI